MAHLHDPASLVPDRHVPAKTNTGWPYAFAIIALAIAANLGVYYVYSTTESWRKPIDPMFRSAGQGKVHGPVPQAAGGHGGAAPAGEHGAAPAAGHGAEGGHSAPAATATPAGAGH